MENISSGYAGKVLRVNLSNQTTATEALNYSFCRKYLGGAGFVAYYLLKELAPRIDPLSPENKLIFALGPVTGLPVPGSGRNCVGAKSPLTGTIAKSEVGGFWGAELKRSGFDAVIIEGKAIKPVYLWIHDGEATIQDATHLRGKKTKDTQAMVRSELGDDSVQLALTGPGGENMVRFASISNGLFDAAGRGGLGAVMGSKNLKAVAVRGRHTPKAANPEALRELRQWVKSQESRTAGFHDFGTGLVMADFQATGNLPVRNFRDGLFPTAAKLDASTIRDTIRTGMEGCFACPVKCKKIVQFSEPYSVDPAYGGPEYETLAALGSNCGIDDLKAVCKGNELCGAYSLDTISTGAAIAFAMECFEKGLLTSQDTGGLNLKFGNSEAMLEMIEMIANRRGIGDLLAEGTARAAGRIGRGAAELTLHVKGLEPGMHDPRRKAGLGLGYMVNPHGADHCCNMHDTMFTSAKRLKDLEPMGILEPLPADDIGPRKVALFKIEQAKRIIEDCLVICQFLPYDWKEMIEMTEAATGWNTAIPEQMKVAERVLTMARLFNLREGFTADDDRLPERFFQPKTDGVLANKRLDRSAYERARGYYYTLMGWDARTGVPLPEKLEELGIS
ncbi:MAG: aldehyde ferredoxin oxidoreductase family protein [Dehalococcoidales bacterium]|nr:aldehyde ferredoxin oxidoreductase family protein [Dehalococcoidales bacterium]